MSKTVAIERVRAAVAAGLTVLGENRVQEGAPKAELVPDATWHLIGPLQSNKVRRAVDAFDVVESVDSVALAERLDRVVREARGSEDEGPVPVGARLPVLLQVNVDDDPAKAGFPPAGLATALPRLLDLGALRVDGLMTIGRLVDEPEAARPTFRALARARRAAAARGAAPRSGAVDGHDRRLPGRGRGGRHDRPRRTGVVRVAADPMTRTARTSRPTGVAESLPRREVRFMVRLTPRGGIDAIDGVAPDGALRARVAAAPVDGAANSALVRLLADRLELPPTAVRIVKGATARRKTIVVEGATPGSILARWPGLGL